MEQNLTEQSTIHYERASPQVAKTTFANPPVNRIVDELATDPDIQVVVFESSVSDLFYNHFDLAPAADFPAPKARGSAGVDRPGPEAFQGPLHHRRNHPGPLPWRGNELALAFDLGYASREKVIFG